MAAVRLIADGGFERMVACHGPNIDSVPIVDAIGLLKYVPPDGEHVDTARALGIALGD